MSRRFLFWLMVGMIVLIVDLQGFSAINDPIASTGKTEKEYQFSTASNDLSSQINHFSQTEFEGRVFREERKVQLRTNSGIRFVTVTNYNRLINAAEEPCPDLLKPVELSVNLSFIQKLQL